MYKRQALVQHIAGTVQRKAQAAFPVIVGTHPRDKRTDFLLLVTGQLPGVHLSLRATMARRAGLHDQRPELLPAPVSYTHLESPVSYGTLIKTSSTICSFTYWNILS